MYEDINMCKNTLHTDQLLEMISSTTQKQMRVRGNLRIEVLLKSTHHLLDQELRVKQQSRKRKWEELKTDLGKKYKLDDSNDVEMDESCEELLGLNDFFSSLKAVTFPMNGTV